MDTDRADEMYFSSGRAAQATDLIRAWHDEKPRKGASVLLGAHGARETPVPIPNTEVKPRSGYYTAFTRGKIARCRFIE